MNRETTVADLAAALKREIADRQRMLADIEARMAAQPQPRTATPHTGAAAEAVEILRSARRPMHGLHEIVPELARRGFVVRSRAGFCTALLRTKRVVRTAPGTFAYAEPPANDAGAL
jgi:hypothetical protein